MSMANPIPKAVAEAAERLNRLEAGDRPASVYGDLYLWEQKRDEDRKFLANEYRSIIATQRAAEEVRFIPDDQGGHLVAHGKVWRPTEEKP